MSNGTFRYEILRVEGLRITQYSAYPVFVLLLLTYVFIMVSNVGIIATIAMEKALRKPMYLLFVNLPVSDALNASVVLPALLKDILNESDRYVGYAACVLQAFGVHSLSTSVHTILMVMCYDRYVAICEPLRYHTVMTNEMVVKLSLIAWASATLPVIVILGLTVRLSHCTSKIANPYCDNPSLFKLSCEDLSLNQIVGLLMSVVFLIVSLSYICASYLKIAHVCLNNRNSAAKSKAAKTCSTHLIVYLVHFGCSCTVIILHRFSSHEELRNLASILIYVVPPSLNPVVYGLQIKEIRRWLEQMFLRKKAIPG